MIFHGLITIECVICISWHLIQWAFCFWKHIINKLDDFRFNFLTPFLVLRIKGKETITGVDKSFVFCIKLYKYNSLWEMITRSSKTIHLKSTLAIYAWNWNNLIDLNMIYLTTNKNTITLNEIHNLSRPLTHINIQQVKWKYRIMFLIFIPKLDSRWATPRIIFIVV